MKNRKSYYSLLLALVLCLCLTACGGSGDTIDDGGEDYSGNEVNTPDSFEGMVKDSELATNYAMYWGTWVDADNNSELIVAMADSGDEVRFDLYQDGSIEASGFVQFSQEYSGDYFYNEFDGWAHHCWLADDGTLQIEGNFLILLACDVFDVPYRSADGEMAEGDSERVYEYFFSEDCCTNK